MSIDKQTDRRNPRRLILLALLLVSGLGTVYAQVQLDVCGCRNNPASLGDFDSAVPSTYPPGITAPSVSELNIALPPDGVMIFNSFRLRLQNPCCSMNVRFIRNAANTPVTILVAGDLSIDQFVNVRLGGDRGNDGTSDTLSRGGLGGPGGFRGGDGAYQLVNFARLGGAGLGPGSGLGGTDHYFAGGHGANATFVGAPDLLPLVGGSGGGGGASTLNSAGCAGGGAGGGGGALLMAANGTVTINGEVIADGGDYGFYSNPSCSSNGGGGSGGAVRVIAQSVTGFGHVYARGGNGGNGQRAQQGAIRVEALSNTMAVSATDPLASRTPGPGPVSNPITPTVAITSVAGQAVSATPAGAFGGVDLVLPAPGQIAVALATSGVPSGTTVNVTVKPRVGGNPVVATATLTTCSASGDCTADVAFNLAAGAYFVEARATFQTQLP